MYTLDPRDHVPTYTEAFADCPFCGGDLEMIPTTADDSEDRNPPTFYGCPTCFRTAEEIDVALDEERALQFVD